MRNHAFDALKGGLILLVLVGHVLPGSLEENGIRHAIYFFHMPLFLAVTGYFIKKSSILRPVSDLGHRYYNRMILPYLMAFVVFTGIFWVDKFFAGELSPERIVGSFFYPYLHLWYIPAMLLFIFYTRLAERFRIPILSVLFVAGMLTLGFERFGDAWEHNHPLLLFMGDKRFYGYYTYFLIGYVLANHISLFNIRLSVQVAVVLVLVAGYGFFQGQPWEISALKVAANVVMIHMVIAACESLKGVDDSVLSHIGRHSLPIYLWHVLPLMFLWRAFDVYDAPYFFWAGVSMVACVWFFLYFKGKYAMLERTFYGR